jgi:hypothetical protein
MAAEIRVPLSHPNFIQLVWHLIRRPRHALAFLGAEGGKKWLWMALLATVAVVLPVLVAAPITTRVAQETMIAAFEAQSGQMQNVDPEIQQQISSFATNPIFTIVLPGTGAVFALWIGWVVWTAVLHFSSTLMGGNSRFGQMWQVVVWAWLPFAVRGLIQTIYILLSGELIANAGLSGLIDSPKTPAELMAVAQSPSLMALQVFLSRIDLFLIWNLILISVGVMVVAKLSARKASLITLGIWILFTLLAIAVAVVPTMLFASSF